MENGKYAVINVTETRCARFLGMVSRKVQVSVESNAEGTYLPPSQAIAKSKEPAVRHLAAVKAAPAHREQYASSPLNGGQSYLQTKLVSHSFTGEITHLLQTKFLIRLLTPIANQIFHVIPRMEHAKLVDRRGFRRDNLHIFSMEKPE